MKKYILIILLALVVGSCTNDELTDSYINDISLELDNGDIILRERNKNRKKRILKTRSFSSIQPIDTPIENTEYLLGYSYKVEGGNSIMGDYVNFGIPIIDVKRVKKIETSYPDEEKIITTKAIKRSITNVFTYENTDTYNFYETQIKKVESGLRVKVGPFSFGRRKKLTETFTTIKDTSSNVIYGDLSFLRYDKLFSLHTSGNINYNIMRSSLSHIFLEGLYSQTMDEVLKNYGEYVVTGYYVGGKVDVIYAAEINKSLDVKIKTKELEKTINASLTWEEKKTESKDTVRVEFKIGMKDSLFEKSHNYYEQLKMSINTYGGNASSIPLTLARDLKGANVDLSNWLHSLNDENTHTVVDIEDHSLYFLSSFVNELNFKRRLEDIYVGILDNQQSLQDPYIEIIKVYVRTSNLGVKLYEIVPVLNTRNGDKIALSNGKFRNKSDDELMLNNDKDYFIAEAKLIKKNIEKYFEDIAIKANYINILDLDKRSPLSIKLDKVDFDNFLKVKDNITNIIYLYDKKSRIALSYYGYPYDESSIPYEYGMEDWVLNLQEKEIPINRIHNTYTIIGL